MAKKVRDVLKKGGSPVKDALDVAAKKGGKLKSLKIKLKFKE